MYRKYVPRIPPKFGVSALVAIVLTAICPTPARAQTWGGSSGYNDLVAELGGAPATQYDAVTIIASDALGWRYRKGDSEPPGDWNTAGFLEDGTWSTGQTPIGYGDGDDNTTLLDMEDGYTSVYLRHTFTVAPAALPAKLTLRVYFDDGAIVWINGEEVGRFNVSAGFNAYDATTPSSHEAAWEEIKIPNAADFLVEGANVIAIHGINRAIDSSDFSLDAELLSPALRVTQVEANPQGTTNFLPEGYSGSPPSPGDSFSGSGIFGGKTIHIQSTTGVTYSVSSHARNVGERFYSSNSISPGLALVDNFDASGWLNSDFLRANFSFSAPRIEANHIQNHSWVIREGATTVDVINDIVRRQDYAVQRDDFITVAGLDNGSNKTVPPGFGGAYNVISVGLSTGGHSRGGTLATFDGPGRIKPEIVATDSATSYTTPQVGSGAALLLAHANTRGMGNAFTSYVMKAILMAGAEKSNFQNGSYTWSRTKTEPLDAIYGAGHLDVQHSYHILDAGEQSPAVTAGTYGWDKHAFPGAGNVIYTLELEEDIAELSCLITWNRIINDESWLGGGAFSSTLADMSLQLHRVDGGSVEYDSSDSPVDNVEHVYLRGLAAGTYTLTVATDVAVDFAIAWRAEEGALPEFTMSPGAAAGSIDFAFTDLAVGKQYTLKSSTDMSSWDPEHTFTATAATDSHTLPTGLAAPRTFYKLTWEPMN